MASFRMKGLLRLVVCMIALFLACLYAFITLRGPSGLSAVREQRQQIRELQEQNADLAREIELKRERINKLCESQCEQELEIRRRLKLLRERETTFILQDPQPRGSATAPPVTPPPSPSP